MTSSVLPDDFQRALLDFEAWPSNSILQSTNAHPAALNAIKSRLDSAEPDLFEEDDEQWEVPLRDLHPAPGEKPKLYNAHSEEKLMKWLEVQLKADVNDPKKRTASAKRRDPKCRFIYIYGDHARASLKINREMMTLLMTYHQVMPTYLDFMLVFGAQSESSDLRFSGFREQTMISTPARGLRIPDLGRSGRQFQLCYNLNCVAFKSENKTDTTLNEWSIRPAAIHHQFDVIEGTTLWIVTKGREDLLDRFKELTGKGGRPEDKSFATVQECFRSSLAVHLMFCHWSTEDWRWYIRWLEDVIEQHTVMSVYGPRGLGYGHQEYRPRHIQDLQLWADKVNEAIMVLESNVEVMTSLRMYYDGLKDNGDFPLHSGVQGGCSDDIRSFTSQIDNMISDFKMQISRAKLLVNTTSDRKELVLQHLQSQASERMETVSYHMAREAIIMKIITIVALIYLPATFVSTFFSTDIIKYQNQDGPPGSGSFSMVAMIRWLQVTVPLTALTLGIAWFALKFANRSIATVDLPTKMIQKLPGKTRQRTSSLLPLYNKKG